MAGDWIEGGCCCGAVRYRVAASPLGSAICHCRTCRRAAGAESVAWLTTPVAGFALTRGAPALYASSPGVERGFCAACGTSLTFRSEADAGTLDVTLASLDDPEAAPPKHESWLDHRVSWNPANTALPGHAGSADGP